MRSLILHNPRAVSNVEDRSWAKHPHSLLLLALLSVPLGCQPPTAPDVPPAHDSSEKTQARQPTVIAFESSCLDFQFTFATRSIAQAKLEKCSDPELLACRNALRIEQEKHVENSAAVVTAWRALSEDDRNTYLASYTKDLIEAKNAVANLDPVLRPASYRSEQHRVMMLEELLAILYR